MGDNAELGVGELIVNSIYPPFWSKSGRADVLRCTNA
jgi:hypothetical protein